MGEELSIDWAGRLGSGFTFFEGDPSLGGEREGAVVSGSTGGCCWDLRAAMALTGPRRILVSCETHQAGAREDIPEGGWASTFLFIPELAIHAGSYTLL